MRQLTILDAQFLAVEDARTHGHVCGLSLLDPGTAPEGSVTLEGIRERVAERLYRGRLGSEPLNDHRPSAQ